MDVTQYNAARTIGRFAGRALMRRAYARARAGVAYSPFPGYKGVGLVGKRIRYTLNNRRMRKFIKRVANGQKETHFVDYNWGKVELYHNSYFAPFNCVKAKLNQITSLPPQGDGDSNRTGNDIFARGIQVKAMFGCKQDRHNTTFRVLALRTTKGYDVSSYTAVFDAQTNNIMMDGVDKDRVSVIFDKKIHYKPINPSPDGKEITIFRKFWIPHKTQYKFYDDNTTDNSYPYDIWFIVMAYDAYGSLQTDNIAYIQFWSRFYFKDK